MLPDQAKSTKLDNAIAAKRRVNQGDANMEGSFLPLNHITISTINKGNCASMMSANNDCSASISIPLRR